MNKLLQRQINKYLGADQTLPANILKLLSVISESYEHYEKDRQMLERSIELSSGEMKDLNSNLRKEIATNQQHLAHLEASQRLAKVGSWEIQADIQKMDNIQDLELFYVSEESYRILSYSQDTFINAASFFSCVYPDDLKTVMLAFQNAITNKGVYDIEHRIV